MTITFDRSAHMAPMTISSRKPIVLWDMDGVSFEWMEGVNRILLELDPSYPIIEPSKQTDYNLLALPGHDPELLKTAMNYPGLYRHLDPVEYAVEAAQEMQDEGIEVRFCTSPYLTHMTCASEKLGSIREHFGDSWVSRTILTNDKTFVHGDILIDDHPAIRGSHTPTWKQLVFDRPYNRHLDMPRMSDWRKWREAVYPMLESSFAMR